MPYHDATLLGLKELVDGVGIDPDVEAADVAVVNLEKVRNRRGAALAGEAALQRSALSIKRMRTLPSQAIVTKALSSVTIWIVGSYLVSSKFARWMSENLMKASCPRQVPEVGRP